MKEILICRVGSIAIIKLLLRRTLLRSKHY